MRCKNSDEKYYTGKENTPLGRGFSASGEKVGTRMRGRDGKTYVVQKYSNGKRWVAVSSSKRKTSPRIKFGYEGEDSKKWKRGLSVGDSMRYSGGHEKPEISRSFTNVKIGDGILNQSIGTEYPLHRYNLDNDNWSWFIRNEGTYDPEEFGAEVSQKLLELISEMDIDVPDLSYDEEKALLNIAVRKVIDESEPDNMYGKLRDRYQFLHPKSKGIDDKSHERMWWLPGKN